MKMKQTNKNLDVDMVIVFSHLREDGPYTRKLANELLF